MKTQTNEDVESIVELIYSISPFMVSGIRERWASLFMSH